MMRPGSRRRRSLSSPNYYYRFKVETIVAFFVPVYLFFTITLYYKASKSKSKSLNSILLQVNLQGRKSDYPSSDPHFDNKTRSFLEITPFVCAEEVAKSVVNAQRRNGAITAVTQMTADKLQRLTHLASHWVADGGYISVAIYIPDEEMAEDTFKNLQLYFEENAALFKRVVAQLVVDKRPKGDYKKSGWRSPHEYPVNILRNIALEKAPSDHIMYVDVDFIPSVDAHSHLVQQLSLMGASMKKMALILPAFERKLSKHEKDSSSMESFLLPTNKADLLPFVTDVGVDSNANEIIAPFHLEEFPPGHGPTQFPKWFTASEPYQVDYVYQFEPYFVINKVGMPPFWEYFRGRYFNKFSWVGELFLAGYSFYVDPSCFLIHINHEYHEFQDSEISNHQLQMMREFDERFNGYLYEKYRRVLEQKD